MYVLICSAHEYNFTITILNASKICTPHIVLYSEMSHFYKLVHFFALTSLLFCIKPTMPHRKRDMPFQAPHTIGYGLNIYSGDLEMSAVTLVMCRLCYLFIRKGKVGKKRKSPTFITKICKAYFHHTL